MPTCRECGEPIEFRYMDGVCTPIHIAGGWCRGSRRGNGSDDICYFTNCPECGDEVWFIRHNGGCVWVDQLGWPWEKHGCFRCEPEPKWFAEPQSKQLATRLRESSLNRQTMRQRETGISNIVINVPECLVQLEQPRSHNPTDRFLDQILGRKRVKVWAIFNNQSEMVAYCPYPHEREARDYAAALQRQTGKEHFVQLADRPSFPR